MTKKSHPILGGKIVLSIRVENYLKDIISWLWCVITRAKVEEIDLREVIEFNQGHVFEYYWDQLSKTRRNPFQLVKVVSAMKEESFQRAIIFRSYNVIEVMCKNGSIEYISKNILLKSICDLLSSNIWESRQIVKIFSKYYIFISYYGSHAYPEKIDSINEMVDAATKSRDRWALDTLAETFPCIFTESRTNYEILEHIRSDNYGMLKAMIGYNFDVHVIFDAALSVASRNCNPKIIKLLLDNGADIKGHKFAAVKKALIYGKHEVLDMYLNASWKYIYDGVMPPELAIKLINQVAMGEEDSIEAMSLNCEATKLRNKMTKLRMQEIANVKEEA